MFPTQFLVVKNMPRKTGESLLMLLPTCAFHAILMHMACAHLMRFSCTQPMCILYGSRA